MKVGIVTISDLTNYGNRLQNYALSHLLRSRFGCSAVSLAARGEKPFENGNYILWLKNWIARNLCVFPAYAEKRFGPNMTRWASFYRWDRRWIPSRTYYRHARLPECLADEFDCFLAGSDQIWNYRFPGMRYDDFFLKFAREEQRAAVSASFGVEEIPEELRQTYVEGLKGFAHLSVREQAGGRLVKDLVGRDVPVLLDPTMMLSAEEWESVAQKPRVDTGKPYVLKYFLGDSEASRSLERWAEKMGYAVYELMNPDIPQLYAAGPGEFLTLIRNAKLVCSDSFHCIAFSILFSVPFVVFARQGREDYMTSRLKTLLEKFRFQGRWAHILKPEDYPDVDFSHVERILAEERQRFLDYLANVVNKR